MQKETKIHTKKHLVFINLLLVILFFYSFHPAFYEVSFRYDMIFDLTQGLVYWNFLLVCPFSKFHFNMIMEKNFIGPFLLKAFIEAATF